MDVGRGGVNGCGERRRYNNGGLIYTIGCL